MIRIQQIKLKPDHSEIDLIKQIRKKLHLAETVPFDWEISRQSVDARKKPEIYFVYTVDVACGKEEQILKRTKNDKNVSSYRKMRYSFPDPSDQADKLEYPPVIVGSGPAGLFCALMLARKGFRPILLERGDDVAKRQEKVDRFWKDGMLDPESNVQFGEGGAGTFSDGKLNSVIKDPTGRIGYVLDTFVNCGADPKIRYSYKPHIGTDVLTTVVRNIRNEIISLGGRVLFRHKLIDFSGNSKTGYDLIIQAADAEGKEKIKQLKSNVLVLAPGHSARDTFRMLSEHNMKMHAKAFAVGVRVIHPQTLIDEAMYGVNCPYEMEAAPYKVTGSFPEGNAYSFCMCPGGYVVNASSEEGHLAVNGMSYHDRDGKYANSAIVVSIGPDEFDGDDPLAGIDFQKNLEKKAYLAGNGMIPVQMFSDYVSDKKTEVLPDLTDAVKGVYTPADVKQIFPKRVAKCIKLGIDSFGRKIKGFNSDDTLLCAVESRTSSPIRLERDENCVSLSHKGIYPCGEGAGYAGGITSAAVDGIRVAEHISMHYFPGEDWH